MVPPQLEGRASTHAGTASVAVGDVLASLSRALDLTEGQPLGHSMRSCIVGMRIGQEAGLDDVALGDLYYALLLKDAGCSSNAARLASLFGTDDQRVKPDLKIQDWDDRLQLALATWNSTGRGLSLGTRVRHFVAIAREEHLTRDLIATRCERGADIARRLGFPPATASAIRSLDEHWNGGGHPDGLRGDAIPMLSRILNLAQTLEVYWGTRGPIGAADMLRARRGTWFDPALVDLALPLVHDSTLWSQTTHPEVEYLVAGLDPQPGSRVLNAEGLDDIAQAFADIIDAKSPFTFCHSSQVAMYAVAIGERLGLDRPELVKLRRAGLLHDIGKLGVSNRILDKPGKLDPAEREAIQQHPVHTWEILKRVSAFSDFAWVAALHHEKLDGTGYPWGLGSDDLPLTARILAVADIYEALTATRPYRAGLSVTEALAIIGREAGRGLDRMAVDALEAALATSGDEAL